MPERFAYAFLRQKLARELCTDFFRGILGREPDEEGLESYVRELRRRDDIPPILQAISRSPEAVNIVRALDLTPDDVRWCYRSLLGREPESPAVVERLHRETPGFRALVESFVGDAEFQNLMAAAASSSTGEAVHRLDLPPEDIESRCGPVELAQAWDRVRGVWEHLGAASPHHSVMTEERFEPHKFESHEEAFWASGVTEAGVLAGLLQRHGVAARDLLGMDCVEFGCGVGRVTFGLAPLFRKVEGWDISAAHLELARDRMARLGQENVSFRHCAGPPGNSLLPCDIFYSRIVFQHNPPPIIRELILAALEALNPGGTAVFQLPVHSPGYRFSLSEWLAEEGAKDMEMHCLPQAEVFALIAESGCSLLEVREENSPRAPAQFISNVFVVRRPV